MIRAATALILTLVLAGCGFQLRSALSLPTDLGPIQVEGQGRYSPLADSLSQALIRSGATVVERSGRDEDVARLRVLSERWGSTPISIDARGRAQEYTLRYAVVFELVRADGEDLVPQQAVELARDYIQSPSDLTGADSERELLSREMRRDMVASILRRIDGASRQP
ncbi:LPS assembly lipoprotein LptE [Luteimonas sp. MJ293]|uniref:LPS-assembly lipoprotein LptE n=1 Tax=Luteimonas sp. MJ146 TaxID=3129240 RepID=UPI0031B9BF87